MVNLEQVLAGRIPATETVPGVYFLVSGEEIVYIGQSYDTMARVAAHKREQTKTFDSFYVHLVPDGYSMNQFEALLICQFHPKYNANLPVQDLAISFLTYRRVYQLKIVKLRRKILENRIHEKRFWLVSDLHKIFNPHLV